jgi:succinate dehydrogenase/fumarate reductase-like Fe-S protein
MGLQRKMDLDEQIKFFPMPVRESIKKMIVDIEENWKRSEN